MTIQLHLPPDLEQFVAERVQSEGHAAADSFLLQLLRDAQRGCSRAELEAKLLEGIDALERGEGRPMTSEDWRQLRADLAAKFPGGSQ
jgi:hypothetical protein